MKKNKKLKVLFISESFPPYANGGAGISTSLIVKAIKNECDCRILTQKFNNEEPWKFEGFDVLPIMTNYSPNFNSSWKLIKSLSRNVFYGIIYRKIKKQIEEFKPDILHIQLNHYDLINKIVSLDIPSVIDFRDTMLACPIMYRMQPCNNKCANCLKKYFSTKYEQKKLIKNILKISTPLILYSHKFKKRRFIENINSSQNSKIVALSNFVKNLLIKQGISKEKIETIYNVSDLSFNQLNLIRKNQIVFAGSVDFSKGIFTIIKAVKILNKKDLKLMIFGSGPELNKVKKISKKLNINFLGKISPDKVLKIYARSKIILAPSIWPEPFGRFIQESITTKTPCIATNIGGIPEGIKDHETGLLVKPNNPKKLAKAINELLTNKKLYNKIVKNLEKESDRYCLETIGKQRKDLYKELIKNA